MNSVDLEVLQSIVSRSGEVPAYLFTVARTWGSAPRRPGSLLVIHRDGRQIGSVSGGCVEEDLGARAAAGEFEQNVPRIISFGVGTDEAKRVGLPCGGRLDLLVERIEAGEPWSKLLEALEKRRCLARRVCLATGEASLHPHTRGSEFQFDGRDLVKVFGPRWELLVIGANQIARYLVPLARSLDYRVIICEPREEVRAAWDLEGAELTRSMPDDVVKEHVRDDRCAVVALTHDPKLDDMALMEALGSPAFYVGALGSRRSSEKRRQRLLDLDVPAAAVDRLRAPVGLPIGGRSPPEIALAIAAELTALRNRRLLQVVDPPESPYDESSPESESRAAGCRIF